MSNAYTYTKAEVCKHPAHSLFTIGKAHIWAGSAMEMEILGWDLRIRFTDGWARHPMSPVVNANEEALHILGRDVAEYGSMPTLDVTWEDYGIPELDKVWWEDLVAKLKVFDGHVAIYCQGGHGRTGTALAILATLGGVVPPGHDAVAWLRKIYCKQIVESGAQIRYIEQMTGIKPRVQAASQWVTYQGGKAATVTSLNKATNKFETQYVAATPAPTLPGWDSIPDKDDDGEDVDVPPETLNEWGRPYAYAWEDDEDEEDSASSVLPATLSRSRVG